MSDLDPSELYQMIGQGLIDAAPADWMEAGVKGAWFTVTARLDGEGRVTFDFDYDTEPQFEPPISVGPLP